MKTLKLQILASLLAGLALTGCDDAPSGSSGAADAESVPLDRKLDAAQLARGKTVYEKHCLECHGDAGKGQPGDWRIREADGYFPPPPLDDSAHAWHHPTAALLEVIRDGSPQGQGKMPAWKDTLSEQEMQDVVAYIKSLWSDPVYRLWQKMEQQSLEP
ncbi:MAG: cytochrome C [Thiobacillus sp. 63-78]|uniref:c-type cytochrome n=1 Tax=Thiobacillus sp. 63-78 TaxID=1895859 RepID=UPI000968F13E|nr:cytochrome c [Thiobacillus sp. 63-78]MBN8772970.1 cytochrome c [Thiobacillus sp.]OJZ06591.1 MAG: cytochrome C [Thiobacillus sp. 63-78]